MSATVWLLGIAVTAGCDSVTERSPSPDASADSGPPRDEDLGVPDAALPRDVGVPDVRPRLDAATCAPVPEVCNGRDDDCDGVVDGEEAADDDCDGPHAEGRCARGECQFVACTDRYDDCDGDEANGCETSLDALPNCGACGEACELPAAIAECTAAGCAVESCEPGRGNCDEVVENGCETSLDADDEHCGACGMACSAGLHCRASTCRDTGIAQLVSGGEHACVVWAWGGMSCWGNNRYGELGTGIVAEIETVPVPVVDLDDAVSARGGHRLTCAVRASGHAACWGDNFSGQLGDGTWMWRLTPTEVVGVSDAVQIAPGENHTCALLRAGQVMCWGANENGALGDGTESDSLTAVEVVDLPEVVTIASGYGHVCAIDTDGAVWCWGLGSVGQLGDGTEVRKRTRPVMVLGIDDAIHVSAGIWHTCALRRGGRISCWGWNGDGRLGDGTSTDSAVPVDALIDDAIAVQVGHYHSCAIRSSGAVACWGDNSEGAIGDGTLIGRSAPVEVPGVEGAIDLAAGFGYTCARTSSAEVLCWGFNASGQLGDGTTERRSVPGSVLLAP